ncbi:MAG: cytochrome c biogenesis protein CcsA [Gammaproteobacteria bacterium]|nr:cytochrome c biogenesis protein CcsA [Gammaproteobacteria bacterium]MDD9896344.1 cytochrome c biogenesis protein CcsA [Gammaproteobacteria bacterium]MDD9960027.1 cytochrome c biogenesis protein CcsA [Gammaproteobacteria bacterium]
MQVTVISGLFAVFFYLMGSVFQGLNFASNKDVKSKVFLFGAIAVFAHAISAYGVIRTASGFHFGISEISTLIAVSISLLVLLSSIRKPLDNLFLGLFPLAIITIIASLTIRSDFPATNMSIGLASHVLISILAYSFITIAAVQAGFLAYQNHQLKNHHAGGLISKFPPLQDMEAFLFELLWVGQLLLSLGIIAGLVFIDDIWGRDGVIHKTFFSALAWIVFAVLLWGRHQLGWRGVTAIRGTLTGFGLLIIGFYGSKFILEYILA